MKAKKQRRLYENVAMVMVRERRHCALLWTRRGRKSTTLGSIAFDEMAAADDRTVIQASASLLLGKEGVGAALSALEQAMIVKAEAEAVRDVFSSGAEDRDLNFQVAARPKDGQPGDSKVMKGLTEDDFAGLYRASRLELRLYFDRSRYSRLLIIAPNPATARSWRGTVLRDEVGYTPPALETDLQVAMDPMMRDTPDLKLVYGSNLPGDSRHPWFAMTLPREIKAANEEDEFPANASGHLFVSQTGLLVHRVALKDAYQAGHQLFDDKGLPMSYEDCAKSPQFRVGWDISYALNHKTGGAGAVDLIALVNAQRAGVGECAFVYVENEGDWQRALSLLRGHLTNGRVNLGLDVASTAEEKSNPSSITVTEETSGMYYQRLVAVFKTKHRAVVSQRLKDVCAVVAGRSDGGRVQKLSIDAGNERMAAEETANDLRGVVTVELVIPSASIHPPGYSDSVNFKTYQSDLYSDGLNNGLIAVPPDEYIKLDHLLPIKDMGRYTCAVDSEGRHGDSFDSGKQSYYGFYSSGGAVEAHAVRVGGNVSTAHTGRNNPLAPHFDKAGGSRLWI
ncbi:MAG: hypothetical protein NT105_23885 [Verrucomicrobia bacterium]|nr:hypothetical protein [Verrucomicrobiota bacterium]